MGIGAYSICYDSLFEKEDNVTNTERLYGFPIMEGISPVKHEAPILDFLRKIIFMDEERQEKISKLKDQIWTTRVSRVNAERRLIAKEKFVQGINIYYSCCAIIFTVLSLLYNNPNFGMVALFMTIALFSAILYLSNQKYLLSARDYRENYTKLQKLEMELEHSTSIDEEKLIEIDFEYCILLNSSSNHEPYDYYKAVFDSHGEYKENRWKEVRLKFRCGFLWRLVIKAALIVLPEVLFIFCIRGGI